MTQEPCDSCGSAPGEPSTDGLLVCRQCRIDLRLGEPRSQSDAAQRRQRWSAAVDRIQAAAADAADTPTEGAMLLAVAAGRAAGVNGLPIPAMLTALLHQYGVGAAVAARAPESLPVN